MTGQSHKLFPFSGINERALSERPPSPKVAPTSRRRLLSRILAL